MYVGITMCEAQVGNEHLPNASCDLRMACLYLRAASLHIPCCRHTETVKRLPSMSVTRMVYCVTPVVI